MRLISTETPERRQKRLIQKLRYREAKREELATKQRAYYRRTIDARRAYDRSRDPKRGVEYCRKRRATDINYRIAGNLRTRLNRAIAIEQKTGSAVRDLGCSIETLKSWLMYQFQIGMTWENYGSEWEIDHVRPLLSFDLTNREQFLEACNWFNLQPMWQIENRSKGAR